MSELMLVSCVINILVCISSAWTYSHMYIVVWPMYVDRCYMHYGIKYRESCVIKLSILIAVIEYYFPDFYSTIYMQVSCLFVALKLDELESKITILQNKKVSPE